ncbi:MAG TPA: S8 family serine peptidase [Pyrinomonadaceae bacterium]|nr:S8 family serine peptidase [Pyrinomonadaceae bacterium]
MRIRGEKCAGLLCLMAAFFALVWALAQPPVAEAGVNDDFVAGEVVVKLTSAAELSSVAAAYGLALPPLDQFGARPIYRLRIADGEPVAQKVTRMTNLAETRVVYAEPNYNFLPPEVNRPSWSIGQDFIVGGDFNAYKAQWAAQTLRLSVAHNVTRGAGVKVAVLDTGVEASHPALVGRVLPGFDFVDMDNDASEVASPTSKGAYGHGTHVAGLIALVAPEAQILPVRVLDPEGVGNVWVLSEALAYAADPDGNPATDDGADIINLSLGTIRRTKLLSSLLSKVCSDVPTPGVDDDFPAIGNPNVVVVAAAGNTGDQTEVYPGAENINGLLAVAATTKTDRLASFSTRGSWIGAAAPGDEIVSSVPGGQYGTWRGTSMAAPFAAGGAALLRAAFPLLKQAKIVDHLERTGDEINADVKMRLDLGTALTRTPEIDVPPSPVPGASVIQFSAPIYSTAENGATGMATLSVTRTGDASQAASVNYKTWDTSGLVACGAQTGNASERCDYATSVGTLRWAAGETGAKTISVPVVADKLSEGNETFNVTLSGATGATLGTQTGATVTIVDDTAAPSAQNPIDGVDFFIRQQYIDFLGRQPDTVGFQNWVSTLAPCPGGGFGLANSTCDRVHVTKSFYQSDEFQTRGYWAYRFYETAFGRRPAYAEFIPDMALVGGPKSPEEEALSKQQFTDAFVLRPEFVQKYGALTDATLYVEALLQTAGLPNHAAKASLIAALQSNQKTRAQVLKEIVESAEVENRFFVRGFVSMQYFGYLRRDPDALGFDNYVNKLTQTGDPRQMVFDFIYSTEYRGRFGTP